jgi:peptide/nickel transport system substrate-binding protein
LIYETLLYFNRLDGTVKPWLASSYDRSSDATSITFHLRQGVLRSDGQPFTSDDVVFTLGLLQKYPSMDVSSITPFIKNVSAPDAHTVQVTLNKPFYGTARKTPRLVSGGEKGLPFGGVMGWDTV